MELYHTKGEWKVGKNKYCVVSEQKKGITIGISKREINHYGGYLIAESVSECNTSLIVSAPLLLEAIEEMIKWYSNRDTKTDLPLDMDLQEDEVVVAMKAVNKALNQEKYK